MSFQAPWGLDLNPPARATHPMMQMGAALGLGKWPCRPTALSEKLAAPPNQKHGVPEPTMVTHAVHHRPLCDLGTGSMGIANTVAITGTILSSASF